MKFKVSVFFSLLFSLSMFAQPDYKKWDDFLRTNVSTNGFVNYAAIKAKRSVLDQIVSDFSKTRISTSWSKNDQLAFWINAYNVFTIKLIVDNYPIKSIQSLDNGKPWDVKRILIDGKKYSLNNIENDIIRPQFKDARIHFAVNCAAKSCPPLMNGAFFPKNLDAQLDTQTKKFFNDSKYQQISASSAKLSKILDWYKVDFGNVVDFINQYSPIQVSSATKISFLDYDWALNGK